MNFSNNKTIYVPPVNLPKKRTNNNINNNNNLTNLKNNSYEQNLPPQFFENIFDTEMKLKTDFSMSTLEELINLYSIAIDYYSTRGDEKYEKFNKNLQILLNSPDVKKNINMLTEKGKIIVKKQERKNFVNKELENIDKNSNIKEIKEILENFNSNNNKNDINIIIDKNLNTQENNFLKRKEEKKKKINNNKLSKSQTFNEISFINKNYENFNLKNNFSDDLKNENENFFEEFSNIFNEKILNQFTKQLNIIYINKTKELLKIKEKYKILIKQNEIKIDFLNKDSDDYEDLKEEIENEIFTLKAEEKVFLNKLDEKFNKEKENLINYIKNILIKDKKWLNNLKEKYSKNLEQKFSFNNDN